MVSSSQHQLHCLHVATRVRARAPAAVGRAHQHNTQRWGRNLKYRPPNVVGDEEKTSPSSSLSSPAHGCAFYMYFTPAPGSWLLAVRVSGSRVQADMSPAAAQMLRTLAHYFRQCHNVRVSSVTNNFKQECNTRS